MSDKKYHAGNIPVNLEQMAVIEEAMNMFKKLNGVALTRSKFLTILAFQYVRENKTTGEKS